MIQLEKKDYHKVRQLIHPGYLSNQILSVLKGVNVGDVYIDKEEATSAMIYHRGENGYYFIGDSNNIHFLNEVLRTLKTINKDNDAFEFSGDSDQWDQPFNQVFGHLNLKSDTQEIYLSNDKTPLLRLDSNYRLVKINKDIIQDKALNSIITEWWYSTDEYLNHNIGYVALDEDKIIGHCVLDGSAESYMGIGIAVHKDYRKKGLASSLASYVITDILEEHCIVYWECTSSNIASKKTAQKCGLVQHGQYKLYWFDQKNCS